MLKCVNFNSQNSSARQGKEEQSDLTLGPATLMACAYWFAVPGLLHY